MGHDAPRPPQPARQTVRLLSATADVDLRTATRALTLGAAAIHGGRVRDAIVLAAESLGIELPTPSEEPSR
jgi:hypothetical protein